MIKRYNEAGMKVEGLVEVCTLIDKMKKYIAYVLDDPEEQKKIIWQSELHSTRDNFFLVSHS